MTQQTNFEAIIVGGSYAGLSAAMALGRSLRNVLIIDSGKPCNRTTPHSHNFITQDGETPQAISQKAKEQVLQYKTVQFLDDLVTDGKKIKNGFEVTTQSGLLFKTKKLIFATGIKDLLPTIECLSACWGISVIHCPYCHGYEFKNKKTGIMANGEHAFHLAGLVRNLTNDVTIFTQGKPDFTEDQLQKLNNQSVKINENPIQAFVHNEGHVKEVVFTTHAKETFDAVYAAVPFEQHCKVPVSLGCELTETGHIKTDMVQKTTVPGVYACGDNASMMRSVAYAVATGNIAGAMVNKEITEEEFN